MAGSGSGEKHTQMPHDEHLVCSVNSVCVSRAAQTVRGDGVRHQLLSAEVSDLAALRVQQPGVLPAREEGCGQTLPALTSSPADLWPPAVSLYKGHLHDRLLAWVCGIKDLRSTARPKASSLSSVNIQSP